MIAWAPIERFLHIWNRFVPVAFFAEKGRARDLENDSSFSKWKSELGCTPVRRKWRILPSEKMSSAGAERPAIISGEMAVPLRRARSTASISGAM